MIAVVIIALAFNIIHALINIIIRANKIAGIFIVTMVVARTTSCIPGNTIQPATGVTSVAN